MGQDAVERPAVATHRWTEVDAAGEEREVRFRAPAKLHEVSFPGRRPAAAADVATLDSFHCSALFAESEASGLGLLFAVAAECALGDDFDHFRSLVAPSGELVEQTREVVGSVETAVASAIAGIGSHGLDRRRLYTSEVKSRARGVERCLAG